MTELDYDGFGNEEVTITEGWEPVGNVGGLVEQAKQKVLNDPELRQIYEEARLEQQAIQYNREVVPDPLRVRREKPELFHALTGEASWPNGLTHRELTDRIGELKAEERRLLGEYRGSRRVGEVEPLRWLAEKVWPNGAEAHCPECLKGRKVETKELAQWLRYSTPKCKRCGVEVTLK